MSYDSFLRLKTALNEFPQLLFIKYIEVLWLSIWAIYYEIFFTLQRCVIFVRWIFDFLSFLSLDIYLLLSAGINLKSWEVSAIKEYLALFLDTLWWFNEQRTLALLRLTDWITVIRTLL